MKRAFTAIFAAICAAACMIAAGCDQPKTYTVAVTCGEGGSYTLSHESPVEENTEVTVAVFPEYGYTVGEFTVNGQAAELQTDEYTFTVQSDVTAKISFKKLPTYELTVVCGENGRYTVEHEGEVVANSSVELVPLPDLGYEVDKVYLNGMTVLPADGKYILNVTTDCTVNISFKEHIHSYGEWAVTVPTPEDDGSAVRVCPNCPAETAGHTEERVLPPLTDERYSVAETTPATCVDGGEGVYSIEIGGENISFTGGTPKRGHSYRFTIETYPTKNYGGVAAGICQNCGEETEGHTLSLDLPTDDGTAYTVTDNSATCTLGGRANYSITVDGYSIRFSMETEPLGHDFSDGTGKCSRCSEGEGVFDSRFIGVWKTDGLPERTLEIGGNSVTLNGEASASVAAGERTDGGDETFTFTVSGTAYTAVACEGRFGGSTRYYILQVSYLHPDTHLPLTSQYFRSDYPIPAFPSETEGRWAAGENILSISGKTLRLNEERTVIRSYLPSNNGFTLTFDGGGEGGLSSHAGGENFTLKYTKNTNTLVLIDNAAGTQTECTVDTSLDKVLIPEGFEGTFASADGEYIIVVDAEGRLSFNGVRYALNIVQYYVYSFVADNIAYTVSLYYNMSAMTLNCAALAIENVTLSRLNG